MAMATIKEIQKLNDEELRLGMGLKASWHWRYKDSAWVYAGGLDERLGVGDVMCVMSQ